jgi:glycosyltransferase involved in cell wall biosynthesis
MAKKIFFDGLNLSLKQGTGIATYTRVLAGQVRRLGHETGILYSRPNAMPPKGLAQEVVFFDEEESTLPPAIALVAKLLDQMVGFAGARTRRISLQNAVLTQPLGVRWADADHIYAAPNVFSRAQGFFTVFNRLYAVKFDTRPDLFHWTAPIPVRARGLPNIYTIHDLVPLRLPYTTLEHKRTYLRAMATIAHKADHIVTVSEHSRRDIIRYLNVPENRVTNTYQAVDIPEHYRLRPINALADELEGAFRLQPGRYFLFYGAMEPKKNIGRLIQAYLAANVDMPLVMVMSRSWLSHSEEQMLKQIDLQDRERPQGTQRRILRLDYLPFSMLMALLRGARGILFPSLYEGFGLPVLEAMAMGTPVITSRASSIPEVAGDAALLVDPYEVDSLRDAIAALARDDDLMAELQHKGPTQAEHYSLALYRERLAALYARLI